MEKEISRLLEDAAYSGTVNPVDLPFCFWAHRKRLYAFKTPWIIDVCGFFVTRLRPLSSEESVNRDC